MITSSLLTPSQWHKPLPITSKITGSYSYHNIVMSLHSHRPMHKPKEKEGKCKVIPLQIWIGPEGFRKLKLPYFKTIGT
jgi:hypothetical protein